MDNRRQQKAEIFRAAYSLLIVFQVVVILQLIYVGIKTYNYVHASEVLEASTVRFERPVANSGKILVLGDSLAYGVGTSAPESSFAGQLAEHFPEYGVVNRSEVGDQVEQLARSIDNKVVGGPYEQIHIVIGGNDILRYGTNLEESADYLHKIAAVASVHSGRVVLVTTSDFSNVSFVPWFMRNYFSNRSNELRQAGMTAADKFANVDYFDAFNFDPKTYKDLEASDGFHLNDLGMQKLVGAIVEQLELR